jgi:hypothetical protein
MKKLYRNECWFKGKYIRLVLRVVSAAPSANAREKLNMGSERLRCLAHYPSVLYNMKLARTDDEPP